MPKDSTLKLIKYLFLPLVYRKHRGQRNVTNDTMGGQMVGARMIPLFPFTIFSRGRKWEVDVRDTKSESV